MKNDILAEVVGIAIALYVTAMLVPGALVQMANATLTGVDAAVITILQILLPTLAVIGIALKFLRST